MNKVAALPEPARRDLFSETAAKMKMTPVIAEKDFWVVWVLDKIFSDPDLKENLMFKGGTSLSKIYDLIKRFSEDIDLILNWKLLTDEDPQKDRSKNKQGRFNDDLNEKARIYIKKTLLPKISCLLGKYCQCAYSKKHDMAIEINYPAIFHDDAILPYVLLEIGPLAQWVPSNEFELSPYSAQTFPRLFEKATCKVNAVIAERTFWEKATILHQEANRSEEKSMPLRYSRHYYDLALMTRSQIKESALKDTRLLDDVINFKQKFYPVGWAKYDEAKPGSFKLIPPDYRRKKLLSDYKSMREMIFGEYLEFDEILETLQDLEKEINSL